MGLTDKLDMLMKERKINKAQLARESGIPYTTIDGFYKKGADNTKLSTLKKLCAYFNCSLDYLADDLIQDEPNTLAAHFDGTEYTQDELDKIKEFAAFVKSNRK
jgi:DNA-binding Xre family transcriptional regulator